MFCTRRGVLLLNKLRKNFISADIIVRVMLVLCYAFASWRMVYQTLLYSQFSDFAVIQGSSAVLVAVLSALIYGVLVQFIATWVSSVFVNVSGFALPRAEYGFWVKLFVAAYYFVLGCLDIINLFTPVAIVWLSTVVSFIVFTACSAGFYFVTKKVYFNSENAARYFCKVSIVYVIFAVLEIVSGISRVVVLSSGGAL